MLSKFLSLFSVNKKKSGLVQSDSLTEGSLEIVGALPEYIDNQIDFEKSNQPNGNDVPRSNGCRSAFGGLWIDQENAEENIEKCRHGVCSSTLGISFNTICLNMLVYVIE